MEDTTGNILDLYKLDYEKGVENALKLESTKLAYQKFFITMVTAIGSISIALLKLNFFEKNNSSSFLTIESLIGTLLILSSVIGYIIIRNLVSVRRQAVWFNNAIIILRSELLKKYGLTNQLPELKAVPKNSKDSADYITIILCSFINLTLLISGVILLIEMLTPLSILATAFPITITAILYFSIHYHTVEKLLIKEL